MRRIWLAIRWLVYQVDLIWWIVAALIIWGFVSGWWAMVGISLALFVVIAAIFQDKRKIMKAGGVIVLLMIPAIKKKVDALKKFQGEAEERVIEQVRKNEDFALFLVTEDQLFKGFDSEGRRIRPPYAALTRQIKRQKGQPTDRVTLRDTGAFYEGMEMIYGSDEFTIINIDAKTPKLRAKYGRDILGLNKQSRDLLALKIKPDLQEDFKQSVV